MVRFAYILGVALGINSVEKLVTPGKILTTFTIFSTKNK